MCQRVGLSNRIIRAGPPAQVAGPPIGARGGSIEPAPRNAPVSGHLVRTCEVSAVLVERARIGRVIAAEPGVAVVAPLVQNMRLRREGSGTAVG